MAQWLGGSGFISCFTGGILFGWIAKGHKPKLLLAAEGTGDTLALITWVVFGAAVVGQSAPYFSWRILLYALLSLTLVRMVPVFLTLAGMGLRADEKLFMGWFYMHKNNPGDNLLQDLSRKYCLSLYVYKLRGLQNPDPDFKPLSEYFKRSPGVFEGSFTIVKLPLYFLKYGFFSKVKSALFHG